MDSIFGVVPGTLLIQPVQIFKINSESDANQQVENAAEDRPFVRPVGIIPQFPESKEEEKDRGSGYQNLVGSEQPHKTTSVS
jgi:hypothetical protein